MVWFGMFWFLQLGWLVGKGREICRARQPLIRVAVLWFVYALGRYWLPCGRKEMRDLSKGRSGMEERLEL